MTAEEKVRACRGGGEGRWACSGGGKQSKLEGPRKAVEGTLLLLGGGGKAQEKKRPRHLFKETANN